MAAVTTGRRVVVTGLGGVSPLGPTIEQTWKNVLSLKCGISHVEELQVNSLPCQIAATVKRESTSSISKFDALDHLPQEVVSHSGKFVHFALVSADEALTDAHWHPDKYGLSDSQKNRTGISIGSGFGSIGDIVEASNIIGSSGGGLRKLTPFFIPQILPNMAAGFASMRYGFSGPIHSVSSACATGAQSIGDAMRVIQRGDADIMVCGGSESPISPLVVAGFSRCNAMSTHFNDRPLEASRPFDSERDGFVLGEGAAIMILEDLQHAIQRGVPIYAELKGYSILADPYHITRPSLATQQRVMLQALADSGLSIADVDYLNAHAASTPIGDSIENQAIKNVFGSDTRNLSISSIKGATGHLLGASGALEACISILAIRDQTVPPTLNFSRTLSSRDDSDSNSHHSEFDLDYTPLQPRKKNIRAVLSNTFGFGCVSASLIFSKF